MPQSPVEKAHEKVKEARVKADRARKAWEAAEEEHNKAIHALVQAERRAGRQTK